MNVYLYIKCIFILSEYAENKISTKAKGAT